ncbi:YwaF family protein [Haloactinomyces albus]|uniref:Integral membrane protein (TIGR02206 family) n=1 Tax=Haloactinomyces albus TaxID=1352928 RepID=A0AAE3ZB28_9ACTN|nr:TIGR02206 family membrane protein [Haloactinomyces albus]MDR7299947.1 putative integral membrane protein (TIGR02206 family) [Haloactinomyces albus]
MDLLQSERTFSPYGPSHWAILLLAAAVASLLVGIGRHYQGARATRRISRAFAVVIVAFQLPLQIRSLLPAQWNIHLSLPLHLSDLAWITAAYALWSHRWWAHAPTYYWGLTLTTQAMITPALDAPGFPHLDFIEFWGHHCLVLWAAIYLTWGVGMRPDWRGYAATMGVTLTWTVVTLGINSLLGTNYGFLNHKPSNPSLLDLLGPWPWYLAVEFVVLLAGWALITWPWTRSHADR